MELPDIILYVAAPALPTSLIVGINIGTFLATSNWLRYRRVEPYWNKIYEESRKSKLVV